MRMFIIYKSDGEIVSVSKVEIMPENLEQPYDILGQDEAVLEIPAKGDLENLDAIQLHSQYQINVKKKKLEKKS